MMNARFYRLGIRQPPFFVPCPVSMPETTEKYLRLPQHPGKTYTATRTGTLSADAGIDVLYGQPSGSSTWEIRTLLFRRDHGWTWEKVRSWITSHKQFSMSESLQEDFADLLGVEVFRPGTWKGVPYENEDMERVAANSNAMLPYFQAKLRLSPVKLTHDAEQPKFIQNAALGIATKYYTQMKDGLKRVYADFRNVPTVLAKAIEQFYPERSVEKYRYFPHPDTHEPIPDVIKSVAFLGHTPPEVKGMFHDYAVLYEDEHEQSDLVDCFAWRVTDDPADVVLTQDLPHPTKSSDGEAPLYADQKEETMPEEKEILIQEQPTEDASPDQKASVEEAVKSDDPQKKDEEQQETPPSDAQKVEETAQEPEHVKPSETVPDTPQGFSEEDLEKAREQAKQEAADAFAEEKAQYEAKVAKLEAQNFEAEVEHYLEDLHLPESFHKLGVKSFLMSLNRSEIQQYAEDGPEHSQFDQGKALLAEMQKYWEIYSETLSSEQAPEESDRRRNQEQQRVELFKELREDHQELPETEIMKLAAEQRPDLFKETQEEVA